MSDILGQDIVNDDLRREIEDAVKRAREENNNRDEDTELTFPDPVDTDPGVTSNSSPPLDVVASEGSGNRRSGRLRVPKRHTVFTISSSHVPLFDAGTVTVMEHVLRGPLEHLLFM